MRTLASAAGRAFLRAFLAALLTYSFGILAAPDLNKAIDVAVSALAASIAAGLRAIQAYIPALSFDKYLGEPYGRLMDAFAQGFLGAFVVSITGWLSGPDLSGWRSVLVGVIVGAITAGLHAVQNATTKGEWPARDAGIREPDHPWKGEPRWDATVVARVSAVLSPTSSPGANRTGRRTRPSGGPAQVRVCTGADPSGP